jgi:hypothetical protein
VAATIVLNVTFTSGAQYKPSFERSNTPLTGPLAPLEAGFDRSARAKRCRRAGSRSDKFGLREPHIGFED